MALEEALDVLSIRTEVATVVTGIYQFSGIGFKYHLNISGNSSYAVWPLEKASSSFLR